jgi:tocopherol O-methyltransferase
MDSDTRLIRPDTIRDHYDHISGMYRAWWSEHMHHGYWEDGESLAEAQVRLMERLATQARIPHFARVLDVGCGLGGASLWLARTLACSVLGITNSPAQAKIAQRRAHSAGLSHQVQFAVMDANRLDAPRESFDVIWVIECSEHLDDKPGFFKQCVRALKPGGVLALSAWLAAANCLSPERARLISAVCRGFLCPPLATMDDYLAWLEAGGFAPVTVENLTHQVEKTWVHFTALADRRLTKAFLRLSDERTRRCVASFETVRQAYSEGALVYGMFTAEKPLRRWSLAAEATVGREEAMPLLA